jgi:predicted DNA-binding transcriptional regulator YafY
MPRASLNQRVRRLNLARSLLQRLEAAAALRELAQRCSISPRQAYRYLDHARRLKEPLSVAPPKIAFTVKLPPHLVFRLRRYARNAHLNLSQSVSQALVQMLDAGRRRG